MRSMYSATVELTVTGSGRREHFEQVVDFFAALEDKHDDLLDSAWSLADEDDHGRVEVSVTVMATSDSDAWALASSSIRAAIHQAGGFTPDWTDRADATGAVEYRLIDQDVAAV